MRYALAIAVTVVVVLVALAALGRTARDEPRDAATLGGRADVLRDLVRQAGHPCDRPQTVAARPSTAAGDTWALTCANGRRYQVAVNLTTRAFEVVPQ